MDIQAYNRQAWDNYVTRNDQWTVPVTPEAIAAARLGDWSIVLTPVKPVPRSWFPVLAGSSALCLASGGGQQAPILAAAGATVTLLDNSPGQLAQDRLVAERENLAIELVQGDMANLSMFADASFDLIFHPVSNCFVPAVRPVWQEAYRVLKPGGVLLAGFNNPATYIFDPVLLEKGIFEVKYVLPYSDLTSLSEAERQLYVDAGEPLVFGHTFEDQLSGQLEAGFVITAFMEDVQPQNPLGKFMPTQFATRGRKACLIQIYSVVKAELR